MECKVSIITVVYNGEKYLCDTIESVINQTYKNIEYIVIDGGSTDKTLSILKKYSGNINKIISETDEGIYDAMNKGIKLAKGDIVGIINSDDYFDINAVSNIVDRFKKCDCDVVYGDKLLYDEKNKIKKLYTVDVPQSIGEVNISMVHPSTFVKNEVYEKINFDCKYEICADRDLFYKIYGHGYRFCKIDQVVAIMRTGGVSSSLIKPLYEGFVIRKKYLGYWLAICFAIKMPLGHLKEKITRYLIARNLIKSTSWFKI